MVCFHIYLCSMYNQNWAAGTFFFLATCHASEDSVWDPGGRDCKCSLSWKVGCLQQFPGDLRSTCASSYTTNRKLVQNTEAPPPPSPVTHWLEVEPYCWETSTVFQIAFFCITDISRHSNKLERCLGYSDAVTPRTPSWPELVSHYLSDRKSVV